MSAAPKFGRRAAGEEGGDNDADGPRAPVKGWGEETMQSSSNDQQSNANFDPNNAVSSDLPTLEGGGVDDAERRRRMQEEDDEMAKEVAAAPVEYHSAMPKLSELDMGAKWSKVQARCAEGGFDLTCLTDVLSQQLDDEDVAWNPDMLLVQLTSELLDVAERRDEEATTTASPTAAGPFGGLSSGAQQEPLRKRGPITA